MLNKAISPLPLIVFHVTRKDFATYLKVVVFPMLTKTLAYFGVPTADDLFCIV